MTLSVLLVLLTVSFFCFFLEKQLVVVNPYLLLLFLLPCFRGDLEFLLLLLPSHVHDLGQSNEHLLEPGLCVPVPE